MSNANALWSGDLELVASRREQTAALRKQCKVTHDGERRKTERRAAHGVPIRGWLKTELATEWRCIDYPLQLTPDAVRQWDQHMAKCVRLARLANWHHVADYELAEWDHDRRLIELQKPELAACFTMDARGDSDELLRRVVRIRRLADEYLKVLEYGNQVHHQGRGVRHEEHPLGAAKHSQIELLKEVDACLGRRWKPMAREAAELSKSVERFALLVRLPVTDAEGYSRLADRWRQIQQPYAELVAAIQSCELDRPDGGWKEPADTPAAQPKARKGRRKPSPQIVERNDRIVEAMRNGASNDHIVHLFKISAALARNIRSKARKNGNL